MKGTSDLEVSFSALEIPRSGKVRNPDSTEDGKSVKGIHSPKEKLLCQKCATERCPDAVTISHSTQAVADQYGNAVSSRRHNNTHY